MAEVILAVRLAFGRQNQHTRAKWPSTLAIHALGAQYIPNQIKLIWLSPSTPGMVIL